MDLSYYLTANNSVGCTCSSLTRTKVRVFAYCTPRCQNRLSDTQMHIVMETAEQFYMFAFTIAMSESDQFIEVFFFMQIHEESAGQLCFMC